MIQKLVFIVEHEGNEYALKHAPEEWDETSIRWKRSTKYYGISRDFTLPLKFVEDGAKFLRSVYYSEYTEAKASLKIYSHVDLTVGYKIIYEGTFDFSTFIDYDDYVEINIADNSIEAKIKANEAKEYEFNINSKAQHKISMPEIPKIDRVSGNVSSADWTAKYLAPAFIFSTIDDTETDLFKINESEEGSTTNWDNIVNPSNNLHVIEAFEDAELNVKLSISIAGIIERNYANISFAVYDDDHDDNEDENGAIIIKDIFANGLFEYEFNLNIEAGKRYFFIFRTLPYSTTWKDDLPVINGESSTIEISYSNPTKQLTFKGFRADEVFNMLMEKMTGINPEYENEALGQIKISSGDGIRNIEDAKLKTSFADFFKSIHSVTGYCMGLEHDLPVLAPYEYFFNKDLQIFQLGDVVDMEIKPATDFLYGNIKVGYKNQSYEEELGRDEYNTQQEYSTNLIRSSKTLDLVSVYRADHLGIRKIRIDLQSANDEHEDREADNDIFMVFTERTPFDNNIYKAITAEDFESVEGIEGRKDAINLHISPKRNLHNHSSFIKGCLMGTNALLFETAKKDVDVVTTDQNGKVVERRNVYMSELHNALFTPIIAKFLAPINFSKINDLENKNNGYISFRYRGKMLKGFLIETSANISRTNTVEFTVLLTPNINLNNLIE